MTPRPDPADKLTELHTRLADEVAALRSGGDWQRWLTMAAPLHDYSFQNTLLILSQRPDATTVAGYETWKALGRQVDRGEKGIAIVAPPIRRRAATSDVPAPGLASPDPRAGSSSAPSSPDVPPSDAAPPGSERRGLAGFRVTYVWDISQATGPPLAESRPRTSSPARPLTASGTP